MSERPAEHDAQAWAEGLEAPFAWDADAQWSAMVAALGGDVLSVGARSQHRINPLDLGAMGEAAARIGGVLGEELHAAAVQQAVDLVALIVQVNRGRPLSDIQDMALGQLVRAVIARHDRPAMVDLVAAVDDPPEEVLSAVGKRTAAEFAAEDAFKELGLSVRAVVLGDMGQLLGGRESVRLTVGNPGGFCFDTSSIPQSNTRLLSAAMLACWSIGFATIDAHWELSQHDPTVPWGGYLALQDEFWFPMRACEGIIDRADRVGRANRGLGVSELRIVHTPKDFRSLPNPDDREKARGFAERSGLLGLMALSAEDLTELSENIMPLNQREFDMVNGFAAPPGWQPQLDADGQQEAPPGAGKILLKVPRQVGIPVQMSLTGSEKRRHVTDERSRATIGQAGGRR